MTQQEIWLIDEPSPLAPIEVLEQWLFETDIAIDASKSEGEREALSAAHARVLKSLQMRRPSGLQDRMSADTY